MVENKAAEQTAQISAKVSNKHLGTRIRFALTSPYTMSSLKVALRCGELSAHGADRQSPWGRRGDPRAIW